MTINEARDIARSMKVEDEDQQNLMRIIVAWLNHPFDGERYFELNKDEFEMTKTLKEIERIALIIALRRVTQHEQDQAVVDGHMALVHGDGSTCPDVWEATSDDSGL
jgi:hypothetical protein